MRLIKCHKLQFRSCFRKMFQKQAERGLAAVSMFPLNSFLCAAEMEFSLMLRIIPTVVLDQFVRYSQAF